MKITYIFDRPIINVLSLCLIDVNSGWAALHLACHVGDLKAVEILLGVFHDQSHRRGKGYSPIVNIQKP